MENIIYNEDCLLGLKRIPDKSIDLVIMDPPYKIKSNGYYYGGGGAFGTTKRAYHKELKDNELLNGFNKEVLDELYNDDEGEEDVD